MATFLEACPKKSIIAQCFCSYSKYDIRHEFRRIEGYVTDVAVQNMNKEPSKVVDSLKEVALRSSWWKISISAKLYSLSNLETIDDCVKMDATSLLFYPWRLKLSGIFR